MKRLLLIIAVVGALAVGLVAIASSAARGGTSPVANTLVIDLVEKLYGGGHHGRGECSVVGRAANAVAGTLGITVQQLQTELQAGKSVGEVAQTQGLAVDPFKAALTARAGDEIAQSVTDGTVSQARADELNQTLIDNLDTIVDFRLDPTQRLPSCRGFRGQGADNHNDDSPSPSPAPSGST